MEIEKKYATFFGGAMNDTTTKEYSDSIAFGEWLAGHGYTVKNGGYRGLMEAVSIGATGVDGEVIGYTCKTFPSVKGNEYLSETIVCEDIFDRLRELVKDSELFIIEAGGIGTMTELSLVLDITRKIKKNKPNIVIIGQNWLNIMEEVKTIMSEDQYNSLYFYYGFSDFERLFPINN